MIQKDSKYLPIHFGKLSVERLFFSTASNVGLLYCKKNPL